MVFEISTEVLLSRPTQKSGFCHRPYLLYGNFSSPGFLRFVNVVCNLTGDEKKAFLQFTTGCSSLPPGGLANLSPRLTVVRKVGFATVFLS